jgi:hypothetical protein
MNESHEGQATLLESNKEHLMIPEEMTLRDWFAGQTLSGIAKDYQSGYDDPNSYMAKNLALRAYGIADAMMEARNNER